ncbi:MAG: RNA methyltransferase [Candidatus Tokpelaia sp.]|uniref:TrmH family RNA methyltransferase n=1 Tax=Candidatus Tokpelaia sp. TaxID=2233777 RepID=UPI001238DCF3|nr:RNA methyltransferase [Candidatus Tokpelaia sp.]KAA6206684.1 MAG: RNA methyltransferase [Candidatus Tokpelaia sp.]KAA6206979.1 MAG: RNA methyltransferase [Candidatus Tokpelaia sp.]KAA6405565.1 23S rRNA (guanosine(2251)-2'-O)-methyltransferase RlmB [Candidatus Tokpelaia sp.]
MKEKTAKDSHYARLRRRHRSNKAEQQSAEQRQPQFRAKKPAAEQLWLYGFHTVEAALNNPRRVLHRLFLTRNAYDRLQQKQDAAGTSSLVAADDNRALSHHEKTPAAQPGESRSNIYPAEKLCFSVPITIVEPKELDRILGSQAVHQGIALETEALRPQYNDDFGESSLILLLDQITDPHNVGAIMRSAVAFNADFFITTMRHSPQETGVMAKSASGALEKITHLNVRNLAETLEKLHKAGFQTIGLDSAGDKLLESAFSGKKIAVVLGAEGKGLRQKTRQTVSVVARLDMPGAIKSLNVSNAAAIALYAACRHKQA